MNTKQMNFIRRKSRTRAKISGDSDRPRLTIFKSHKYIYAQIIDDTKGHTIASANTRAEKSGKPTERAKVLGTEIAKLAKQAGVSKVVFDRGGYLYAGKVKIVADSAREAGLSF